MPIQLTKHARPEGALPIVSICCITFNQEAYIGETIQGFLAQETSFPVEIIIHDDASTDRTAEIIKEYQAQHPNLIRLIEQTENQYSKGRRMFPIVIKEAIGKYIALCEGDDYWISPSKLENQVAILERDETVALVFHNAWVKHEDSRLDYFINRGIDQDRFTLAEIIETTWFIATASIVFRSAKFEFPDCLSFTRGGDMVIQMISCLHGDAVYHNEVASVYRRHAGGISDDFWKLGDFHYKVLLPNHIWTYLIFNSVPGSFKFDHVVESRVGNLIFKMLSYNLLSFDDYNLPSSEQLKSLVCSDLKNSMPEKSVDHEVLLREWNRIDVILSKKFNLMFGSIIRNKIIESGSERKYKITLWMFFRSFLGFDLGWRNLIYIVAHVFSWFFGKFRAPDLAPGRAFRR